MAATVRRRRLARELRRLREEAGLSAETVADQLRPLGKWSTSKVSRIESAFTNRVTTKDLDALLDLYGVQTGERRSLHLLAKQASERSWWQAYADVLGGYVAFEAEAKTIRTFEPTLIPGLLQTPAYAHALFRAAYPNVESDQIERRVTARTTRTLLLERERPPKLWAIVDEAAVRRPVGGRSVMRAQLDRLLEMGERTAITIQVLPLSAGSHPGVFGSFVILDFEDPYETIVHVEAPGTDSDGFYLEDSEKIEPFVERYEHIKARALGPPESAAFIAEVRTAL